MRILYITTIGSTMRFFQAFIRKLLDEGHQIDIATNENDSPVPECYREWGCGVFDISCTRSPLNKGNIRAIKEIREFAERGQYDLVHCHTPIAAACTRIACRKARKHGTKVLYTAHGFHFYQGAPPANWLIYYPVEKICSRWTDTLITINKEDYQRAKKCFKIRDVEYVPGVGIDVRKFAEDPTDRAQKRKELEVPEDAYVILSVGELNPNKNHQIVLKALGKIRDNRLWYLIAGAGDQAEALRMLAAEQGIEARFKLLGTRTDVSEILKATDLYILPSHREGLNVSLMEAMSSGLPCIASDIRGNRDMIDDGRGGFLTDPNDAERLADRIRVIRETGSRFGGYNQRKAQMFDKTVINEKMSEIYKRTAGGRDHGTLE